MADNFDFDANNVAPRKNPPPVPDGWYRAMVVESAVKPTKNSQGKYLQLDWQILEGPHKGRTLFDRHNIQNPSAVAQKIGQEGVSSVCHTLGVLKLSNSSQLHGKPCLIKVKVKPGQTPQDEPQNEVKGYKPLEGAAAIAPASTETVAASAAPVSSAPPTAAAPAWARKAG